jgi:DNA-binding transcriptional ArsR family regulator
MTPPSDTLRDLSSRRRMPVEVVGNPVMDLFLALWSATGGDDKAAAHELGKRWFTRFLAAIPEPVRARMGTFGADASSGRRSGDATGPASPLDGHSWILLAAMAAARGPATEDPEETIAWLENADLGELRGVALRQVCWDADEEELEAAIAGDEAALAGCVTSLPDEKRIGIERFFAAPVDRLGRDVASVLRDVRATAFAEWEEAWSDPIERSTADTRRLAGAMEVQPLIERVTNGIAYEIPFGITRLVLVPSVTIRPWTLVTEFGDALVLFHPVADEHMAADPDAPPGWLVSLYKALGDERRLRMLRRIGEGEVGLAELTDLLGLAKSTVYHHLGVLRSAGLVRVRISRDAGPTYTLRADIFDDAAALLHDYLRPEVRASERGSRP